MRRVVAPMALLLAAAGLSYGQTSWSVYHADHFDIYYPAGQDAKVVSIASDAEAAYSLISFDLGRELGEKVQLILIRSQSEQSAIVDAVGANGSPDRRFLVLPTDTSFNLRGVLVHELTHQFETELPMQLSDTPAWVTEGLAEHEVGEWSASDLATIRAALLAQSIPAVSHVDASDRVWGHALFDFVATEYGLVGLRHYVSALVSNAFGDDSSRAAFGVTVEDFDWAFKMFVRARFIER
ncbi:MAG TPA: hypothetical protein VLV86_07455 [Vicinamibacterales bacterium]|nr:hypothetical protein [Vicinamibacterales bacterium]